jgi:hypothetical protein
MLHSLAEELSAAFKGERIAMSKSERIVELAEAQFVGIQTTDDGPLVLFRDPVTMSTCAVFERVLTVSAVSDRLIAARGRFGVKS